MQKRHSFSLGLLALFCSAQVQAGGLALYGGSIDNAALSNAGVAARAQGPDTISGNIAGLTYVKGTQIHGGAAVLWGDIKPDLDETNQSGGNGSNALNPVLAPMGYISHQLDDQWTIGFGSYGDFGDELDYDNDWAGRYFMQNAKLIGASLVPSIAFRANDQWSFGLGLRAMYGMVDLQLASANDKLGITCTAGNCPGPDGKVKYDDTDWGYGANAGIIYSPQEGTRIGLAYTSKVDFDFDGNLKLEGIGGGRVISRQDLEDGLDAKVTVPQTATISLFQQLDSQWALLASANWQDHSEFSSIGIQIDDLGVDTDADLHWKDTYHASLGLQYQATPQWLWNAGVGYDTSAVDDSHRIWGLPATDIARASVGAVVKLDEATSIHAAYMFAWLGDVDVSETRHEGAPNAKIANGKLQDAYVQYLGAGMTMKF
jgi:long-chain fatty acid transport protein